MDDAETATENLTQTIGENLSRVVLGAPAVWSNNVLTTTTSAGIKITFAESNPELPESVPRAAVYLDHPTMMALFDLIGNVIGADPFLAEMYKKLQAEKNV